MTDRLKKIYQHKTPFCGGIDRCFQYRELLIRRRQIRVFVFGKCPFLLRWKNGLSGSHALHLRFIRNKSVTRMEISVYRPFIIRYTSGKRAFFLVTCPVLVQSLLNFQAPNADREIFQRQRR